MVVGDADDVRRGGQRYIVDEADGQDEFAARVVGALGRVEGDGDIARRRAEHRIGRDARDGAGDAQLDGRLRVERVRYVAVAARRRPHSVEREVGAVNVRVDQVGRRDESDAGNNIDADGDADRQQRIGSANGQVVVVIVRGEGGGEREDAAATIQRVMPCRRRADEGESVVGVAVLRAGGVNRAGRADGGGRVRAADNAQRVDDGDRQGEGGARIRVAELDGDLAGADEGEGRCEGEFAILRVDGEVGRYGGQCVGVVGGDAAGGAGGGDDDVADFN